MTRKENPITQRRMNRKEGRYWKNPKNAMSSR
jgi:hypothetical protein